jgi:quercetin dioxygenase-like cupin family protein
MMKPTTFGVTLAAALAVAGLSLAGEPKPPAVTQAAPGIKRTILQKFDVPGTAYETTVMRVEFEPNLDIARHTHPGPEASTVLEGEVTYLIDGAEPAPKRAGDSILLPANIVHGARIGPRGAVLLGTYVLEKGKPFITPAGSPAPESPKP